MENDLSELKNIFDFLIPGYLGSKKFFNREFMKPIIKGNDLEKEHLLQKMIFPLKLRRTKQKVLRDLPDKVEDKRYCKLSAEQAAIYHKILDNKSNPILQKLKKGETVPYLHVFKILQLLKQVCNHPALIYKSDNVNDYKSGKFELLKDLLQEALDSQQKLLSSPSTQKWLTILRSIAENKRLRA